MADDWTPVNASSGGTDDWQPAHPAPSKFASLMKSQTAVDEKNAAAAAPLPWYKRLFQGLTDQVYGGAQMGARMDPSGGGMPVFVPGQDERQKEQAAVVDKIVQDREKQYQAGRAAAGSTGVDWLRMGGNVAATLPLSALGGASSAATLPVRLGAAALSGGVGAASQPVTEGNFESEKLKQIATGTAAGGVIGAAGEAGATVLAPTLRKSANALLDLGVSLTPGQALGGIARRFEEGMKSLPILGSAIRSAEKRGVEDFNRAAYNQVLEPIGQKYAGKDVGYEGVAAVEKTISDAYDAILPKVTLRADGDLAKDLTALKGMVSEMPSDQVRQFENIMNNRVMKRLGDTGSMDGLTLKQVESELSKLARDYHGSSDAAQRQLGDAINEVNASLRANLERSNPGSRAELAKINGSWARFTRLQDAAARRAGSDGLFTPGDLLAAAKKGDRSVRKGAFARGDALMQDLARTGNKVISNTLPDSGTAERLHFTDLAFTPVAIPGAALYSSPATNALRAWAMPGPSRNALAQIGRVGGLALSPPAGASVQNQ